MSANPTNRELFRRIWSLSWPMVVYNLLEMTVGFVDLLMVRPFGPEATAAIGVSRQVTFLIEGAVIAIATGVITLVSQGVGARSAHQVDNVVRQSVWLVLLLGIPTSVVGYVLSRPILVGLQASAATVQYAEPYLHVYFAGMVLAWGSFVGTAIFRGSGDATTPLKLAVVVNLLNVVLNYVFIFGAGSLPGFGVMGAAMGTVGARGIGLLLCLCLLLRGTGHVRLRFGTDRPHSLEPDSEQEGRGSRDSTELAEVPAAVPGTTQHTACGGSAGASPSRTESWTALATWIGFDRESMARILRIGFPMALASVLRNSSRLVFLAIVGGSASGVSFHAAVGIGLQVRLLSILPATAFQAATAALVGQAIGRGDYDEAAALGWRSVQLLAVLTAVVVGSIFALADPIAASMIDSAETAKLGAKVLRWFAVAQFFSALSIGTQGALIGAGDTKPAMRYTLFTQWLVMLPLSYVLLIHLGGLPDGPLAAWTLAPAIALALMLRRLGSGRWKDLRV
ncbi:MAG: MATE family efflux transporter [Planctomycetes bacterium]|nr:MATE family efflux transporter [Planctomycetota bacterium]